MTAAVKLTSASSSSEVQDGCGTKSAANWRFCSWHVLVDRGVIVTDEELPVTVELVRFSIKKKFQLKGVTIDFEPHRCQRLQLWGVKHCFCCFIRKL